jgi:hypothetical protein
VVRSGASTGTIKVTVEAEGLASGSVSIQSVASPRDEIPGIIEPFLRDDGRVQITRDRNVKPAVFAAKPHKLNEITQDYDLPAQAAKDYRAAITAFIQQRNLDLDTSTSDFQSLAGELAAILVKTHGHLVADDYNFLVRRFNDAKKKKSKGGTSCLSRLCPSSS